MTLPTLFKNAGVPLDVSHLSESLGMASAVMNDDSGAFNGRDLLKILQDDGSWVYGLDEVELGSTDRVAVDPSSFQHGYVSWKESKIAGEQMVGIGEILPVKSVLPVTGKEWVSQYSYEAVTLADGDELIFKNSSMGAAKAIKGLFKALRKAIADHPNYYVPVITLSSSSYINKNYGNKKIYNPIFTVVDWADINGNLKSEVGTLTADEPIQEEIVNTDNVETADDGQLDIEKINTNAKTEAPKTETPKTETPKTEVPKTTRRTRARARG